VVTYVNQMYFCWISMERSVLTFCGCFLKIRFSLVRISSRCSVSVCSLNLVVTSHTLVASPNWDFLLVSFAVDWFLSCAQVLGPSVSCS
jgi:hypothetical protein